MRRPVDGDLELRLLRTFLALAEHRNMRKTATVISMTQPAISAQMSRLAKVVGHRLFVPCHTGVELTRHGELLLAYAQRVIALSEEALAHVRNAYDRSRLALGISGDGLLLGFGDTIKWLQRQQPSWELKVEVAAADNLQWLLASGKVDVAIAHPSQMRESPSATWQVPLAWVASRDLEISVSKPLPLAVVEGRLLWQQSVLETLNAAGWMWHVSFESASFDAIVAAVHSGVAMCAMARDSLRARNLCEARHPLLPPLPEVRCGLFLNDSSRQYGQSLLEGVVRSVNQYSATALIA
jgi:DNA-binding transcriptional LysR family regulator